MADVSLSIHWRTVPVGIHADHWRLAVMPSFVFETKGDHAVPLEESLRYFLWAWPELIGSLRFKLQIVEERNVAGLDENYAGHVAGEYAPLIEGDAAQHASIGRKLMRRAITASTVVQPSDGPDCQALRAGAAPAPSPRVRSYDETNLVVDALQLRAKQLRYPVQHAVNAYSPVANRLIIATPGLRSDEYESLFEDYELLMPADPPLQMRLDNRALSALIGVNPEGRLRVTWSRDLHRLAGHGRSWFDTLAPDAVRAVGAIAWAQTLPSAQRDKIKVAMRDLADAWVKQLLGSDGSFAAAVRKVLRDFPSSGLTDKVLEQLTLLRVPPRISIADENDWLQNWRVRLEERWDRYLNLVEYQIAHHHEEVRDPSGALHVDERNDIGNRLAELSAWPRIARFTGLVFDVSAPMKDVRPLLGGVRLPAVRLVCVNGPRGACDASYWTAFELDSRLESAYWPRPLTASREVMRNTAEFVDGTLNLPARYRLRDVDVEAATKGKVNQKVVIDTQKNAGVIGTELDTQVKGLSTSGLVLTSIEGLGEAEGSQQAEQKQGDQMVAGKGILLRAEDLTVGYRIDVQRHVYGDQNFVFPWRSLCERQVRYHFDEFPSDADNLTPPELEQLSKATAVDRQREQGFIRNACRQSVPTQAGETAEIFPGTALCVWRDRSLAMPDEQEAQGEDPFEETDPKSLALDPVPFEAVPYLDDEPSQSLLRVRSRYYMGGRIVYASGDSLSLPEALQVYERKQGPTRLGKSKDEPYLYEDQDTRQPPAVHLAEVIDSTARPGDEIETIIVRSGPDFPPDSASRRWIVPPRVSIEQAELEGALDCFTRYPDGALRGFQLDEAGDVPSVRALGLGGCPLGDPNDPDAPSKDTHCNDTLLRPRVTDPDPEDLPYYPDPRVLSFAIAVVDDERATDALSRDVLKVHWYAAGRSWPDAPPVQIELRAVSHGTVALRSSGKFASDVAATSRRALALDMPPGTRRLLRLWSLCSGSDVFRPFTVLGNDVAGALDLLHSADSESFASLSAFEALLTNHLQDSSHPSVNPVRHVRVMHAVQRPLAAPAFGSDFTARRFARDPQVSGGPKQLTWNKLRTEEDPIPNAALLEGTVLVDRKSTGRIEISAERDDWIDDLSKPRPSKVRIKDELRPIEPIDNSESRVDPVSVQIDDAGEERNIWHEIRDSKHHTVRYHLKAYSAFQHLFPQRLGRRVLDFCRSSCEELPEGREVTILSTRPPAAPAVAHVIPTFVHKAEYSAGLARGVRRTGLRVWLDRPWFDTGNGEQLAIICGPAELLPRGARSKGEDAPPRTNRWRLCDIDAAIRPYVSQVALDPTLTTGELVEVLPPNAFARTLGDRVELPDTDSNLLLREREADSGGAQRVAAVLFDVGDAEFDCTRRQYRVDIGINLPALSWQPELLGFRPFIRLCFARYQKHSFADRELSHLVVADMLQLQPNRTLNVRYDPRRLDVVDVELLEYGIGEHELSNSTEAPAPLDGYEIRASLLERPEHAAAWIEIEQQQAAVRQVGDGFVARLRFELPTDRSGRSYAVRIEEALLRPGRSRQDSRPNSDDPFAADSAQRQPILFMLQPLSAPTVRELEKSR